MIGHFSTRVIENSATHTRHSLGVHKFQIFSSRMHFYVTWDTFVFLQASAPRWYGKHTTVKSRGIFGVEKIVAVLQKYFYWPNLRKDVGKHIRSCTACVIAKPTIKKQGLYTPLPTPSQPWESTSWITCRACLLLSMEMTLLSWLSTYSQRWPLWRPARRISQQKPLLKSSLNECGCTLGSHSLSYQIGITGSSTHFGPASGQCWIPSSPSRQLSIPKQMAR